MWKYTGHERPPFAERPNDGQESVWDYPRPPIVQPTTRSVVVRLGDVIIAKTSSGYRLLETASPPGYYVPKADVYWEHLVPVPGRSLCEWKGAAQYWGLANVEEQKAIAWSYANPNEPFDVLKDCVSFYPGRVECFVDGERVRPQPGAFYGGWMTDEITGPVKGESGTGHW